MNLVFPLTATCHKSSVLCPRRQSMRICSILSSDDPFLRITIFTWSLSQQRRQINDMDMGFCDAIDHQIASWKTHKTFNNLKVHNKIFPHRPLLPLLLLISCQFPFSSSLSSLPCHWIHDWWEQIFPLKF